MPPTDATAIEAEKLARMAKQIADFFRPYPEEEARAGIRDHIQSFWTPAMQAAILRAGPDVALDPLVAAALRHTPRAESPILKETAGPDTVGQLASDAG